jgi:transposase
VAQVCQLLGVGETAVRRWVAHWRAQQDPPDRTPAQTQADRQKIMALEAEVARLEEERDLLKKSIAFFVRENHRPRR